jgi:DNA-binding winged helix-turn-helix (wHTH) protein
VSVRLRRRRAVPGDALAATPHDGSPRRITIDMMRTRSPADSNIAFGLMRVFHMTATHGRYRSHVPFGWCRVIVVERLAGPLVNADPTGARPAVYACVSVIGAKECATWRLAPACGAKQMRRPTRSQWNRDSWDRHSVERGDRDRDGWVATTALADSDEPYGAAWIRIGSVTIHPATRAIWRGLTAVHLKPKEYDLLLALFSRRGQSVTRAELLRDIWHRDPHGRRRTIDTHVASLRKKLGWNARSRHRIVTVHSEGYMLTLAAEHEGK